MIPSKKQQSDFFKMLGICLIAACSACSEETPIIDPSQGSVSSNNHIELLRMDAKIPLGKFEVLAPKNIPVYEAANNYFVLCWIGDQYESLDIEHLTSERAKSHAEEQIVILDKERWIGGRQINDQMVDYPTILFSAIVFKDKVPYKGVIECCPIHGDISAPLTLESKISNTPTSDYISSIIDELELNYVALWHYEFNTETQPTDELDWFRVEIVDSKN